MGAQFSDPSPSDLSPSDLSCAFVNTFLEIAQHVIARAHGEGDDGHRGRLVSTAGENACVTNVKIGNVMGLRPLVRNRGLGIISKPADSSFVQAGSWAVGLIVGAPQLSAHRLKQINHDLF